MKIHHDKQSRGLCREAERHRGRCTGAGEEIIEEILTGLDSAPEAARKDLRNQGGGHYNHSLFWQTLKKADNAAPSGELAKAIDKSFTSFAKWQDAFSDAAMKTFGSGWAWLVWRGGKLVVESTPNQDCPLSTGGTPLLGIDVVGARLLFENTRTAGRIT